MEQPAIETTSTTNNELMKLKAFHKAKEKWYQEEKINLANQQPQTDNHKSNSETAIKHLQEVKNLPIDWNQEAKRQKYNSKDH